MGVTSGDFVNYTFPIQLSVFPNLGSKQDFFFFKSRSLPIFFILPDMKSMSGLGNVSRSGYIMIFPLLYLG